MTQQNGLDINNQEQNKEKLTHFNEAGEAHMVDVHAKDDTYLVPQPPVPNNEAIRKLLDEKQVDWAHLEPRGESLRHDKGK